MPYLIPLATGLFVALIMVLLYVAHLRIRLNRAEEQGRRDPLTGALNRRGWRLATEDLVDHDRPIAVAIIDLDKFKQVNDNYGHTVGDAALVAAAEALAPFGTLARLGGDEFALAAKTTSVDIAIPQYVLVQDGSGSALRVTLSAGCADVYPDRHIDAQAAVTQAMAQADAALYTAKTTGRGVMVRYLGPELAVEPAPLYRRRDRREVA